MKSKVTLPNKKHLIGKGIIIKCLMNNHLPGSWHFMQIPEKQWNIFAIHSFHTITAMTSNLNDLLNWFPFNLPQLNITVYFKTVYYFIADTWPINTHHSYWFYSSLQQTARTQSAVRSVLHCFFCISTWFITDCPTKTATWDAGKSAPVCRRPQRICTLLPQITAINDIIAQI